MNIVIYSVLKVSDVDWFVFKYHSYYCYYSVSVFNKLHIMPSFKYETGKNVICGLSKLDTFFLHYPIKP